MNKIIPIVTAVIGVILAVVGAIVLWGVLPSTIRSKVVDEMIIRNHTKDEAYKRFEKLPIPLRWTMKFFHVTNANEFNGSLTSIKFEERGPYVFDEHRFKVEIEFDESGNNVTFREKKNYTFNAKLSGKGLKETDQVTLFHLGLGIKAEVLNQPNNIFKGLITGLTMTDSVYNIAFGGIAALLVNPALFKCDTCETDPRTINTGKSDISKIGQYLQYGMGTGDTRSTAFWSQTPHNASGHCNAIDGTDATQFHPDVKESDILTVYETMLCRQIKFKKGLTNQSPQGIDTLRFYAMESNFAHSDENECYCYETDKKQCQAGALNVRNCPPANGFQVEIIASQPYFQSNHALLDESGLLPLIQKHGGENWMKELDDLNKYGTTIDVEPYTGLVLGARKRVQLNVLLKKGTHPSVEKLVKEKMIAPMMWVEEAGDVDKANADLLRDKIFGPKKTFTGILIAVMTLGVLLVAVAGGCAYFGRR